MIQQITRSKFRDMFHIYGRQRDFSYEALGALYDHYEEVYGGEYELDVIGICCEWSEYYDIAEALSDFCVQTIEHLKEQTEVIELDNSFLVRDF